MYLRDIEIRCDYSDIWKATGIKNTECIELLYLRAIKNKMQCDNIVKINIYLVPIGEKLKEASKNAEVMDLSIGFDFSTFNDIPDAFNKKKFLLNAMQAALIDFAVSKKYNVDYLIDAYSYCIKKNLTNEWLFKNKYFRSPNKVFFTCIQCRYDIDGYYAFVAICDPDKKELGRAIIYKDDHLSFEFDFLRWSDDSKKIFYKFKPPQKIFTALVEDIVQGKSTNLDNNMSNFFKET